MDVLELYRKESRQLRAKSFMGSCGYETRIERDYRERPELLTLDFAWLVMAALCAADVTEVDFDLDAAVAAGRKLYEREGYSTPATPGLQEVEDSFE